MKQRYTETSIKDTLKSPFTRKSYGLPSAAAAAALSLVLSSRNCARRNKKTKVLTEVNVQAVHVTNKSIGGAHHIFTSCRLCG